MTTLEKKVKYRGKDYLVQWRSNEYIGQKPKIELFEISPTKTIEVFYINENELEVLYDEEIYPNSYYRVKQVQCLFKEYQKQLDKELLKQQQQTELENWEGVID